MSFSLQGQMLPWRWAEPREARGPGAGEASGSGVSVACAWVPALSFTPGSRPSLHALAKAATQGCLQGWRQTALVTHAAGHHGLFLEAFDIYFQEAPTQSVWEEQDVPRGPWLRAASTGAPVGPPDLGAPCLGDLGSILCDARRGLERRPQWGQRGLHSGSGARCVATPGRVGAGRQGAQLCPGRMVLRPLPAPPAL